MGGTWLIKNSWLTHWYEWRAQRIADPIERLRYLRCATLPRSPYATRHPGRWGLIALAALGIVLIPLRNSGMVHARSGLDRRLPLPGPLTPEQEMVQIWQVERKQGYEVYSNGLRIETGSEVANEPRKPGVFDLDGRRIVTGTTDPVGIVYHTTESPTPRFEATENERLRHVAEGIKGYVARIHAYHYLIDRFGRVHRIVREQDAAWHAGASVWADAGQIYVNLNHSFLAVAFESETRRGDEIPETVTPAQVHAARTLTDLLRSKYRILALNCATHAQVSVNPDNFRIGNHTDWAANFPFTEIGLPDNYARPLASMYAFGFGYNHDFVGLTGSRLWKGLAASEERIRHEATAQGLSVAAYRALLQQKYRKTLAALAQAQLTEGPL